MTSRYLLLIAVFSWLPLMQDSLLLAADNPPNPVGRPKQFHQGNRSSYGLWYEDGEWQLRVTCKSQTVFTGSVRVEGDGLAGELQGLERSKNAKKADWLIRHRDGRGFDFRFVTFGKTDGVNFKAGQKAESITFKLFVGGDDDPSKILIGSKGVRPDKAVFELPAHPEEEKSTE